MTQLIQKYMDQFKIGAEQSYKNLVLFPVLSDYVIPFDYLTFATELLNAGMHIECLQQLLKRL